MRTLRLLAAAAEAEGLRLKRQGAALGRSAGLVSIAAVFGLGAVVMAHIAGHALLVPLLGPAGAAGAIAAADLALAGVFALVARPRFDPVAQEALMIRREMMRAATAPSSFGAGLWRPAMAVGTLIANMVLARRRR